MEPDIANTKISVFDDEDGDFPGLYLCVRGLKENVEHICNWVLHIQQKLQVTLIKSALSPLVQLSCMLF